MLRFEAHFGEIAARLARRALGCYTFKREWLMNSGWLYFGFIALYLVHMQEEFWTGFPRKFPPKRFAGPLAEKGFWVLNPALLSIATAFGVANILSVPWAFFWVSLWASICFWNAAAHGIWSFVTRRYQPGLISGLFYAPLFVFWTFSLSTERANDWNAYLLAFILGLAITSTLAGFAFISRRIFK